MCHQTNYAFSILFESLSKFAETGLSWRFTFSLKFHRFFCFLYVIHYWFLYLWFPIRDCLNPIFHVLLLNCRKNLLTFLILCILPLSVNVSFMIWSMKYLQVQGVGDDVSVCVLNLLPSISTLPCLLVINLAIMEI